MKDIMQNMYPDKPVFEQDTSVMQENTVVLVKKARGNKRKATGCSMTIGGFWKKQFEMLSEDNK